MIEVEFIRISFAWEENCHLLIGPILFIYFFNKYFEWIEILAMVECMKKTKYFVFLIVKYSISTLTSITLNFRITKSKYNFKLWCVH